MELSKWLGVWASGSPGAVVCGGSGVSSWYILLIYSSLVESEGLILIMALPVPGSVTLDTCLVSSKLQVHHLEIGGSVLSSHTRFEEEPSTRGAPWLSTRSSGSNCRANL